MHLKFVKENDQSSLRGKNGVPLHEQRVFVLSYLLPGRRDYLLSRPFLKIYLVPSLLFHIIFGVHDEDHFLLLHSLRNGVYHQQLGNEYHWI